MFDSTFELSLPRLVSTPLSEEEVAACEESASLLQRWIVDIWKVYTSLVCWYVESVWHFSSIFKSSLPGLYCPRSYVGEASILDSSYVALTFVWVRVVSFMEFNLVLFFFQMPSPARFGCVFHCCTVSQSWSPGSRAGLPRAHPVKHCAPAAHSGLISYACQFSCHKYSELLCMVFGRDRYTVKTCVYEPSG